MKPRSIIALQSYIKYVLVLYVFVLMAVPMVATESVAANEVAPSGQCEIRDTGSVIIVSRGTFEVCLNRLGRVLSAEIEEGSLKHTEVMFVIDRLMVSDQDLKKALMTQNGGAVEYFLGEQFFSNELWANISNDVNFEFLINNNVVYDQGKGVNNLRVNLVETIVLSQVL